MPRIETPPQPNPPTGANGDSKIEAEPDADYKPPKYELEDFSQSAINRGQREINKLVQTADEKIVDAFNEVRNLIAVLNSHGHVDLKKLDDAIGKVAKATHDIAGPYPPGCGYATEPPREE